MSLPQPRKRRKILIDYDTDSSDSSEDLSTRLINSTNVASSSCPDPSHNDDEKAPKSNDIPHQTSRDSALRKSSVMPAVNTAQNPADISRLLQAVESLQESVKVLEGRVDLLTERVPPTDIAGVKHLNRPCLTLKEIEQSYILSEAPPLPSAPGLADNKTKDLWSAAQLLTLGSRLKAMIVTQMHHDFGPVTAIKPNIPTHLNTVDTCHPDPPELSKAAKKAKQIGTSSVPPPQSDLPLATQPLAQPPPPSLNAKPSPVFTTAGQALLPSKPLHPTYSNQYHPGVSISQPPMPYGTHRNDWGNVNHPSGPGYPLPVPQGGHPVQDALPYYATPPLIPQSSQQSTNPGAISSSKPKPKLKPKPSNANLTPLNPHRGSLSNFSQLAASEAAATPSLQSSPGAPDIGSTASANPEITDSVSPSLHPTAVQQMPSDSNVHKPDALASGSTASIQPKILALLNTGPPGPSKAAKKMYSQLVNHPDPMARCVLEVCVRVIETITNAEVVEELAQLPSSAEVKRNKILLGHLFQSQAETEKKLQELLDTKYSEIKDVDSGAQSHPAEAVLQSPVSAEVTRIKSMLGHLIECQNETGKQVYKLLDHHQKSKNVNYVAKKQIPVKTTSFHDPTSKDAKSPLPQVNAPHSEFATQKMLGQVQEHAINEIKSLHTHVAETEKKLQELLDTKNSDIKANDPVAQSHPAEAVVQLPASGEVKRIESILDRVIQCQNETDKQVKKLLDHHQKSNNANSVAKHEIPPKTASSQDTTSKDAKSHPHQVNAPHSEFATQKMLGQVQEHAINEIKSLHAHVDERLVKLEICDPRALREDMKVLASQFKQALESNQDKFHTQLKEVRQGLENKIVSESRVVKDQVTRKLSDDVQRWEKQLERSLGPIRDRVTNLEGSDLIPDVVQRFNQHLDSKLGLIQGQLAKLEEPDLKSDHVQRWEKQLERSLGPIRDRVTNLERSDLISDVVQRFNQHLDSKLGLIQGRLAKLEEPDLKSHHVRRLEKHWDRDMGLIQDRVANLEGSNLTDQMVQMRNEFGGKLAECYAKLAKSYVAYTDLKAICHSLQSKVAKIKTQQPVPIHGSSIPGSFHPEHSLTPSHFSQSPRLQSHTPKSRTHSTILNDDEEPAIPADVLHDDAPLLKTRGWSKLTSERGDPPSSSKQDSNLEVIKHFRPLIEEEIANVMTANFEEDLKDRIQSDLMSYLESEISVLNRPHDMIRDELQGYVEKRLQNFQTSFSLQNARPKDHTVMPQLTLNNDLDLKRKLSFMTHRISSVPVEVHPTPSSRLEQHTLRNPPNPLETSSKLYAPLDRLITLEQDLAYWTSPESQRKATFVSLGICTADADPNHADLSIEKMLFNLLVYGLRNHKDEEHVKGFTSETAVIMREVFNPIFKPMLDAIDEVVLGHMSGRQS